MSFDTRLCSIYKLKRRQQCVGGSVERLKAACTNQWRVQKEANLSARGGVVQLRVEMQDESD